MSDGIERVEQEGHRWIATVRYEHRFEEVENDDRPWYTNQAIVDAVQGASIRRGLTEDGEVLVHQVSVPDAPMRDEDQVEKLARTVTREIES